ncbi:MAG TPA: J domain-containing protein [Allosphingosinicella sp.]|nr:J domain-containing protein [Allosphingosinicella sp.]
MGLLLKLVIALVIAGMIYSFFRRSLVSGGRMRSSEARELLNLEVGATADDIRAAHRRMIARVHPDAGGSDGLATRVNAARDTLLAELKRRS